MLADKKVDGVFHEKAKESAFYFTSNVEKALILYHLEEVSSLSSPLFQT